MSKTAIVLGCGKVGATIARDLAADDGLRVTVADVSAPNLDAISADGRIKATRCDMSDAATLRRLIDPFDLVLGALPSSLGFAALRTTIEARKPYADISFMPEDALELHDLAQKNGVTAVIDCGVSPGLSNMFVGHAHAQLDETFDAVIYVGGLPRERRWPFQYKAPFAPSDVIEEYTRPARLMEQGRIVTKPALTEPELIEVDGVGTLEGFNTDGLRSLLTTTPIPNMREKTLRYPGHAELMRVFSETGFFGTDTIDVNGTPIRPLDLTQRLLFPHWEQTPDEEEFTILRVVVDGRKGGSDVRYSYELFDTTDHQTHTTSMARTTAFPCAIVARMLANGTLSTPGVIPPETLATNAEHFDHVISELSKRGVKVNQSVTQLQ